MSRLDELRSAIVTEQATLKKIISGHEHELGLAVARYSELMAALDAHDNAVAAMGEAPPEPAEAKKRQRHDVRGAVCRKLELLGGGALWIDEEHLAVAVAPDGISADALHNYLLRGVRKGEVERDGDRYRLPQKAGLAEFALAAPEKDAAE